jgi:glycine/D-amino acid oxidase-like deaminating enzyme
VVHNNPEARANLDPNSKKTTAALGLTRSQKKRGELPATDPIIPSLADSGSHHRIRASRLSLLSSTRDFVVGRKNELSRRSQRLVSDQEQARAALYRAAHAVPALGGPEGELSWAGNRELGPSELSFFCFYSPFLFLLFPNSSFLSNLNLVLWQICIQITLYI